jgi:hypothetical protein
MFVSVFNICKIFYSLYVRKNITIQEFKLLISFSTKRISSGSYEYLLKKFDNSASFLKSKKVTFVGKGSGGGSLDTYRKVIALDGKAYFEKVYFIDTIEHKKILYFYENIFSSLGKNTLNIPDLKVVNKGEKLDVFYFEYVDLEAISKEKQFEESLKLYFEYTSSPHIKKIENLHIYQHFTQEAMYLLCKSRLLKVFKETKDFYMVSLFIKKIEERISKEPLWFQHGDLQGGNIFKNNYLIDWDKSTYYPIGYDIGYIFAERINHLNLYSQIDFFIENNVNSFKEVKNIIFLKYFTLLFLLKNKINYDISFDFLKLIDNFNNA